MMPSTHTAALPSDPAILSSAMEPPVALPKGYVGPAWLPGTGRMIYWTGRVAIGLRHAPAPHALLNTASANWVQSLLIN